MTFRFGPYVLDPDQRELRRDGVRRPVEPQVLALLQLLIENRHRVVTKDELIEHIWHGRIVSDAAIASRVKSARQAIGDDGASQAAIRTLPKHGFRFVAEVEAPPAPGPRAEGGRPSIAVLPFTAVGSAAAESVLGEALPYELIVELSRLRWLFVIARGSSFRFRGDHAPERLRAALGVRYCVSGSVEIDGRSMGVTAELGDTRSGQVIWSERYRIALDGVFEVREQIVQSIVSALELHISANEARLARLGAPENLDAWSAYHLGLRHLFRFDRQGNALAASLFERAVSLEPGFARAHAGLSFSRFEDAFLKFAGDERLAAEAAQRHADTALEHEPLDPFCNLVKGRAFWLGGEPEASLPWLERSIRLSPSFAQAKYSLSLAQTLIGQPQEGRANADEALSLSPLDPLAYGMFGVRALTHLTEGDWAGAAEWSERAARAPGAHALIEMIAALTHQLAGDEARARAWRRSALARHPELDPAVFFSAFPFRDQATRRVIAETFEAFG